MADTIFERKEYKGNKYLVLGNDWRYQYDNNGYVWSADGKEKIGYLKEEWWKNEKWYKVMINSNVHGWVKGNA